MRIIRFRDPEHRIRHGVSDDDRTARPLRGELFGDFSVEAHSMPVTALLAPLEPAAIIGIGCNYRRLAAHLKATVPPYPVTFYSLPNALQHPGEPILLPRSLPTERVDYEGELVVVIGKDCKNVPEDRAMDVVFGYSIGNDVSAKDWQQDQVGKQWAVGKGFDSFKPLGPAIVTRDQIPDPRALRIQTRLNGELVQDEGVADMIHPIARLVSFVSASHSLRAGTVLYTGTPFGVGGCFSPARFLRPGDEIAITIDPIGTLRNPVQAEACVPLPSLALEAAAI